MGTSIIGLPQIALCYKPWLYLAAKKKVLIELYTILMQALLKLLMCSAKLATEAFSV